MDTRRVALIPDLQIEIAAGAQSHAAPTDSDGGLDLSTWKIGGYRRPGGEHVDYAPDACTFYLAPSVGGAVEISTGAYVVGSIGSALYKVADINAGAAVSLTTTIGYAQRLIDIGVFDKLWLVDTGDANTHKYGVIPIESLE